MAITRKDLYTILDQLLVLEQKFITLRNSYAEVEQQLISFRDDLGSLATAMEAYIRDLDDRPAKFNIPIATILPPAG